MTRFKVTCRCTTCQTVFSRILRNATDPDPKCPKRSCRKVQKEIGMDVTGPAPAIGGSNVARAVDMTAQMVMQDHGLSDLRDNVRMGETMTPKLPPALERQVEGFWGGSGMRKKRGQFSPDVLAQRALAGSFVAHDVPNPIAMHHASRTMPPINTVASDRKRP